MAPALGQGLLTKEEMMRVVPEMRDGVWEAVRDAMCYHVNCISGCAECMFDADEGEFLEWLKKYMENMMEDKRGELLRAIKTKCEDVGEIGDNFTVNEAKACDKALTEICDMIKAWGRG